MEMSDGTYHRKILYHRDIAQNHVHSPTPLVTKNLAMGPLQIVAVNHSLPQNSIYEILEANVFPRPHLVDIPGLNIGRKSSLNMI